MPELFIGLMSGTSMDAIDTALADFSAPVPQLLATHSAPLEAALRDELIALAQPGYDEIARMARLDVELGRRFAAAVDALLEKSGTARQQIRAIGSHGQTIRHHPRGSHPFTLQIADPNVIAQHSGLLTVADFRRRDVAAGGQGAPLVPAFHAELFRRPNESRAVVNIGGMANVTLLPAAPAQPVIGFDTGPGNVLLDAWAERHLGVPLDRNGSWGAGGRADEELLEHLLSDPYFRAAPPKSTGREHFGLPWLERHLGERKEGRSAQDVQATLAALTARSIADALRSAIPELSRVLVCGGGVHNRALLAALCRELPDAQVESTAAHGVDPDWVEALAFAWLAKRTLDGRPGNLPSVTGAASAEVLGAIYPARLGC